MLSLMLLEIRGSNDLISNNLNQLSVKKFDTFIKKEKNECI